MSERQPPPTAAKVPVGAAAFDGPTPADPPQALPSAQSDHGSAYVAPTLPPVLSAHRTVEIDTIKLDPSIDPRQQPTVRLDRGQIPPPPSHSDQKGAVRFVLVGCAVVLVLGAGILWLNRVNPVQPTRREGSLVGEPTPPTPQAASHELALPAPNTVAPRVEPVPSASAPSTLASSMPSAAASSSARAPSTVAAPTASGVARVTPSPRTSPASASARPKPSSGATAVHPIF